MSGTSGDLDATRRSGWSPSARRLSRACLFATAILAGGCGDDNGTNPSPAVSPVVTIVSGNDQHASVASSLSQPIVVRVTLDGAPLGGARVTFTVTQGGGALSTASVTTDATGMAQVTWILGATAGPQALSITASSGGQSSAAIVARATADALPLATLVALDGDEQVAVSGTSVLVPPTVLAKDAAGAPMAGLAIHFAVSLGGGTVTGAEAVTNASGIARLTSWTLGGATGENRVTATLATTGWTSAPIEFSADAVTPGGIVAGPSRSYDVAAVPGAIVTDTATGVQFRFPHGGVGLLSVGRIVSGPTAPGDSSVIVRFAWTGSTALEVVAPRTLAAEPQVSIWGVPRYPMESPADSQWVPVGTRDLTTSAPGFAIPSTESPLERLVALPGVGGTLKNWANAAISWFYYTSDQKAYLNTMVANVANIVPTWITLITDNTLRSSIITLYGQHNVAIATGYGCPSHYSPVLPNPTIYLCVGPGRHTKSGYHEAGHYVTDLLLYQAGKSAAVFALAPGVLNPSRGHDWGDTWMGFRKTITEDYAFFSEWLGMNQVGGSFPIDGSTDGLFWAMTNAFSRKPSTVDFPSMEGFGIAYIGALLRTNAAATFHNFKGEDTDRLPVTGFTKEDIVTILATGPANITDFNTQALAKGPVPAVQVIAERVGWSYNGSGTIVDVATGDSLDGVRVRSLVQVGTEWFEGSASAPSGTDGHFTIDRLFPGAQVLRLYKDWEAGTDSLDVAFPIDWNRPTTDALEWVDGKLGVLAVSFPVHSTPKTITLSDSYDAVTLYGNMKIHAGVSAKIVAPGNTTTRGTLYYLELFRLPVNSDVPTIVSLEAHHTIGATSWTNWEGGMMVRYDLESIGCRAGRKPHSTLEVDLGPSCTLNHQLAPGAEGQSYQIYVTYSYTRMELDAQGQPMLDTKIRLQGERKMMEVYVW